MLIQVTIPSHTGRLDLTRAPVDVLGVGCLHNTNLKYLGKQSEIS